MLIITANQSQVYTLKNLPAYQGEEVLSWSDAMGECFHALGSRILKPTELSFIWRQCVQQLNAPFAGPSDALAKLAEEAWWLVQHWQIPVTNLEKSSYQNTQWFYQVLEKFQAYCQKNQCLDEAQALSLLLVKPAILSDCFREKQIRFYGFFELTPLQKKFVKLVSGDLLEQTEAKRNHLPSVLAFCFNNAEEELEVALQWAVKLYQQNPEQKISLVIPDLAQRKGEVESLLFQLSDQQIWDFAVPELLFGQALVQAALDIITQNSQKEILLNALISLLHNPYWDGVTSEDFARVHLIRKLRDLQIGRIDKDTVLKISGPWPVLHHQLNLIYHSPETSKKSLSDWVSYWQGLLTQIGFPNEKVLTETEKFIFQQWRQLLQAVAELFPWQKQFSLPEALSLLKTLAQKTFLPLTKNNQAISISGVVDALQQRPDQLWLINATHGNVPFSVYANLLLDKKLQFQYGIWGVNQALQDQWARSCYDKLQASCHNFIVSYAKESKGKINTPAFSFLHFTDYALEELDQDLLNQAVAMQDKYLSQAPLPWQESFIPGGASALKSQRACPMQAFGRYRLKISALPEPSLGLTPIERGNVMHHALHLVWQQLQNQANLLSLPQEALQALIEKIIPLSLKEVDWSRRKLLPKALMDLETQYLMMNIRQWLALEATRPPFKIHALEKAMEIKFADKDWRLRVDRIDELEDGKYILIDYKTGLVSTKAWQLDVLSDPQLPFYVVVNELALDGIAFAELSAHHLRMVGVARETYSMGEVGFLKKVDNWHELKDQWQTALEQLAQAFINSEAKCEPQEGHLTCERCDLLSFCRVFE
jgi:probable DNA repair protein